MKSGGIPMGHIWRFLLWAALLCASGAWAQQTAREPRVGYLYPAGGQQGTVVRILAGGQALRGANSAIVSGEGVHAEVIHYYRPLRNLDQDQRRELERRLRNAWEKRRAELPSEDRNRVPPATVLGIVNKRSPAPGASNPVILPDHPMLNNIDHMSFWELAGVAHEMQRFRKRQMNMQLAEMVAIEIKISADATPGDRELRIRAAAGLTNPVRFQVGVLPEINEQEPNDPQVALSLPETPAITLPAMLNGQIMPGDVDRFRFYGYKGQQLVAYAAARRLIPYLSDAVPGWFQAALSLYDAHGVELAHADSYRFDPDPVLVYTLPADAHYEIEIGDALYRGREDFVYRITLGEIPFISHIFPLGGRIGAETAATVGGYNLPGEDLHLDTHLDTTGIRRTAVFANGARSNEILYAVSDLPEIIEIEPNDCAETAQRVALPQIVNGTIAYPGDVDVFVFDGSAGEEIVAEVFARRLNSPLDALLRLMDASGRVLQWNDDYKDRRFELLTHHADARLAARLPETGVYYAEVSDTQRQGGDAWNYRLHIRPPRPDFALLVTPSSVNISAGRSATICVHAVRLDGFDGDIEVSLANAPDVISLEGGRIPRGHDKIRMTLSAAPRAPATPTALVLEGRAVIGGESVVRRAVPAEDMMQAFLPRHLVPSEELLAAVFQRRGGAPMMRVADPVPVRIPRGGSALVRIRTPKHPLLPHVRLELDEAPPGISIENVRVVPIGLAFRLRDDGCNVEAGYQDNLIVKAFIETTETQTETPKGRLQGAPAVVLPAISIEIH